MAMFNTQRFTGRVDDYARYRPGYPDTVLDALRKHCGLSRELVIADVGAGTGMLSELFLEHGNPVLAVEPNPDMLARCYTLAARYPKLKIFQATGEATTLEAQSADVIALGRSIHWLDLPLAHAEFQRILRPGGWVVIVSYGTRHSTAMVAKEIRELQRRWRLETSAGERSYEFGFKLPGFLDERTMGTVQSQDVYTLTREALIGYVLSMSSTPRRDHPHYLPMQRELHALFDDFSTAGRLHVPLRLEVIYGHLRDEYVALQPFE